ncbi:MAG: DUF4118 domain-containing protein [Terrimicrobiaceae bacterium]|nr:DUF4118 domain-containing protein [Terrimicrobiaceae bacterium]
MTPGRLRIFLGMCPGVGKTYAMLLAAQEVQESGRPVAIGWLETHGRIETTAVAAGLRRIPPRVIEHRGARLEEMDLDALLALRPALAVVDELAHTNAPGSRHPKRHQDVTELLAAGIDVFTTLNVQHIESRRDAVARITGIVQRETVPDSIIDRADELELIDVSPEQLRQRLSEGKVYLGERAARAGEAFFREGNLKALRELALRVVAERADRDVRRHLKAHAITGPWRSRERLLVGVGPSPHAQRLIRLTRRLADSLDATWIAAHADTGAPEDARDRLAANLALARSLGAEVVSTSGEDAAEALVALARRENVTQIIAGKTLGHRPWNTSLSERLLRLSGEIDVLLVYPGEFEDQRAPRAELLPPRWWRDALWVMGLLAGGSALALLAEPLIGYRSVTLLYLLVVTAAGLFLSQWAVLTLAVVSAFAWNFLFTEPRMTLAMWQGEDVLLLATFVIVSGLVGHQTARLLRRERASREDETRARTLFELTRVLTEETDLASGVARALPQVEALGEGEAAILVAAEDGLKPLAGPPLTDKELSVCQWAAQAGEAAGHFTSTLPEAPIIAIPLRVGERVAGILAVRPRTAALASPLRRDLLDAFAAQAAVLIERAEAESARRRAASHDLQRALLDNVSHELKTPAAVIRAGVERLRADPSSPVLDELAAAAARLDRVTTQLVTLSRAEAGLIQLDPALCDAADLLEEVAAEFHDARVHVQAPPGLEFRADPALLHTAIENLVRNALDYTTGPVELGASAAGGMVALTVADRGSGLPEGVFERFRRGDASKPGGLGLGLSISRHFVQAVGGQWDLHEREGGGSVFRIRLPAA